MQQLLWVHVSTLHFFLYLSLYVFPATEAANVLRPGNGPKLLKIVSCHSVIMVFIDRLYPLVQQLLWVHVSTLHFFLYLSLYVFPATEAAKCSKAREWSKTIENRVLPFRNHGFYR